MRLFMFLLLLIMVKFSYTRHIMMSRSSGCYCRYRIQKERDLAINNYNELSNEFKNFKNLITISNCNPGFVIDYNASINNQHNNVICKKCKKNYYRTVYNNTCLHCPEGYISNSNNTLCFRSRLEEDIHTYCPKGTVVGNDPYAEYGYSCIKCNSKKREYMSTLNNEDYCDICPLGSIIRNNNCYKCPIGYYEENNKCLECPYGSYNDIEGSSKCKICNNYKSISYYSIGGTNCEDSIFYTLTDKINENLIDTKIFSYPIISVSQIAFANLYNNRINIVKYGTITSIPLIAYFATLY